MKRRFINMNKLVFGILMLGGVLINTQVHSASNQNIYWKLGELERGIGNITQLLSKITDVPPLYQTEIVHVGRFVPSMIRPTFTTWSALGTARSHLAAITVEDYAIVAGGQTDSGSTNAVDIFRFNRDSGKIDTIVDGVPNLKEGRYNLSATAIQNYAIFAGGQASSTNYRNTIDIYRAEAGQITKIKADGTVIEATTGSGIALKEERAHQAAAAVGNYALFVGGANKTTYYNTVDIFKLTNGQIVHVDKNGTAISQTNQDSKLELSVARAGLAATTIGEYIILAGGENNKGNTNTVDIFKLNNGRIIKIDADGDEIEVKDVSGEKKEYKKTSRANTPANILTLSSPKANLAATTIENYAIFTGGNEHGTTVDIFRVNSETGTIVKIKTNLVLPIAKNNLSAISVGGYALFVGGDGPLASIDMFALDQITNNIIKIDADGDEIYIEDNQEYKVYGADEDDKNPANILELTNGKYNFGATTLGEYALFAGGLEGENKVIDSVEVFRLNKTQFVPLPGLNPTMYITTEIVLNEDDEVLAELQLREWAKISHITAGNDQLIIRYFNDFPVVPLNVKVTVWRR